MGKKMPLPQPQPPDAPSHHAAAAAAAAPTTPATASPVHPATDPRSSPSDLPFYGSFEVALHHPKAQSAEDSQVGHVLGRRISVPERPGERAPSPTPMPATLLAEPSATPSLVPARTPSELTSEEEEEEVGELVDWDDDDDFEATSPAATDALGGETLAGLEDGCFSGPSPTSRSGESSTALPAESSTPSSPAPELVASACEDAEAPDPPRLKSVLVRPPAPPPAGMQGPDRETGEPSGVKAVQASPVSPDWGSSKTGRHRPPTRLKSVLVQQCVPTPFAAAAGCRKTVWRRLKLTEDLLLKQKAQGSKQPTYSPPAGCWELGESSGANVHLEPPPSPKWQTARKKYWWRKGETLQANGCSKARRAALNVAPGHSMEGRELFKKRLAGRCFRCLGTDHHVAQCRDPVRCLRCMGFGHISRNCRSDRRQPISAKLRSRLTFPVGSIHNRLIFPPLCSANQTTTPPSLNAPTIIMHPQPKTGKSEYVPGQVDNHSTLPCVAVVPWCSRCQAPAGDHALDRGRPSSRSPRRTERAREALAHVSEDWERRRSRSPATRSRGWSLHCAPPVSCDPLLDFSRNSDSGRFLSKEDDPMVHEHNYARVPPVALLCDSPGSTDDGLCSGATTLVQPAQPKEVALELGVQGPDNLMVDIQDHTTNDAMPPACKGLGFGDASDVGEPATRDATRSYQEEPNGEDSLYAGMFKPIPAPILQTAPVLQRPVSPPPPTSRKHRKRVPTAPTRSSARQAARPSSIPVAERAQLKLMRELSFIDSKSAVPAAPDAAVTAYIDMYGDNLPEQAVKTIQAATRLGDKELSKALAAIAAESGAVEMEFP